MPHRYSMGIYRPQAFPPDLQFFCFEHFIQKYKNTPWVFFISREKFLDNSSWDVDYS